MDRRQSRSCKPPKRRTVAISIRPNEERERVRLQKLRIPSFFNTDEIGVEFYYANSHPLSS